MTKQEREAIPDIEVYGDPDMWRLLCKESSKEGGWMKSTKAMEIQYLGGCLVQVTTERRNPDGSYAVAEALTYIDGIKIVDDINHGCKLVVS